MTEDERTELARLAVAKGEAEQARYWFGFINIAGCTPEELAQVHVRSAELEAAVVETTANYRAFIDALARRTETAARAHYAHSGASDAEPLSG